MKRNYEDSKFKEWLDTLQQESWQLELIISGVAIFGLIQTIEPVGIFMQSFRVTALDSAPTRVLSILGIAGIMASLVALITCLIVHIVLRGLWIGAVGLRYFSGDIDYESLNYTDKFKTYLKKRIGSFDEYIGRLEDYCSIIFALSFLLVFFFISLFLSLVFFSGISVLLDEFISDLWIDKIIGPIWGIFMYVALLLTALDFFTQGFLKKKKWIAMVYFPIYRFMSRITFSFIYRPLLYNMLDNKLGKRIMLFLVPTFIVLIVLSGGGVIESNYHDSTWLNTQEYANKYNYDNAIADTESAFVKTASIPDKILYSRALPVFVKHDIDIENAIFFKDSTLVPEDDRRGFKYNKSKMPRKQFEGSNEQPDITKEEFKCYAAALSDVIKLSVDDSVQTQVPFTLTTNFKEQLGYETVMDIGFLKKGLHHLKIQKKAVIGDSLRTVTMATIPFWYYPN